ncbi:MAG TPA: hypothetical protein PLX89_12065 [Verrucomicrobiota bacterium]|nr:hypothetical protein [Verrucomicrobiales bacterium]HRI13727.1 hypothetical protein [Verrucomicrobiota bacterium]
MKHDPSPNSKIVVRSVEETASATESVQSQTGLEFASPEELVRHDRAQTPIPPTLTRRVEESVANLPPAAKPWWRRWL